MPPVPPIEVPVVPVIEMAPSMAVHLGDLVAQLAPSCKHCPNTATAVWCAAFSPGEYVCDGHDPTKQPGWASGATPPGFTYRNLAWPLVVPHSTGHLGCATSFAERVA